MSNSSASEDHLPGEGSPYSKELLKWSVCTLPGQRKEFLSAVIEPREICGPTLQRRTIFECEKAEVSQTKLIVIGDVGFFKREI